MSEVEVTLPSVEEMRKRLKATALAPQVTEWLLEELASSVGKPMPPEGFANNLSFIINVNSKGPHPHVRLLTWSLVGAIIEVLVDDPGAQEIAIRHAADISRRMGS